MSSAGYTSLKADLRDARVPNCIYWKVEDVSKWIEELGFPDYKVKILKCNLIYKMGNVSFCYRF